MNISFFTILKDGLLSAPKIGWRTTSPVNKKHLIFVSRFLFIPERETCYMLFISEAIAFLLSLSVSSSVILSFVPTYCNHLSPASFWLAVHPFSPERSFVLQVSPCVSFSVLIFYKRIFRCTLPFQIASKSDRKNSCRFFVVLKEAIRLLLRANYKEFSKLKNGSSCPYALASSLATSRLSRCWIALKISLMHSGMPHSLDLSRRS